MASIREEMVIDASPDAVWDALRDVGALHTRLVPGFVTDTRLEPGARVVTFGNGQVVRELIVDIDETNRRVVWAIVDEPFRHYNGAAQVIGEVGGGCRFVWVTDLLPNELASHVASMMQSGLRVLKGVSGDGDGYRPRRLPFCGVYRSGRVLPINVSRVRSLLYRIDAA